MYLRWSRVGLGPDDADRTDASERDWQERVALCRSIKTDGTFARVKLRVTNKLTLDSPTVEKQAVVDIQRKESGGWDGNIFELDALLGPTDEQAASANATETTVAAQWTATALAVEVANFPPDQVGGPGVVLGRPNASPNDSGHFGPASPFAFGFVAHNSSSRTVGYTLEVIVETNGKATTIRASKTCDGAALQLTEGETANPQVCPAVNDPDVRYGSSRPSQARLLFEDGSVGPWVDFP